MPLSYYSDYRIVFSKCNCFIDYFEKNSLIRDSFIRLMALAKSSTPSKTLIIVSAYEVLVMAVRMPAMIVPIDASASKKILVNTLLRFKSLRYSLKRVAMAVLTMMPAIPTRIIVVLGSSIGL